jgi:hypothetical protein
MNREGFGGARSGTLAMTAHSEIIVLRLFSFAQ